MKRGRTASKLGTSSSVRTVAEVTTTSATALKTAETGAPVCADTQARHVAPESSPRVWTCTACAQTQNNRIATHKAVAHRVQRNSNLAEVPVIGTSLYTELYNELRFCQPFQARQGWEQVTKWPISGGSARRHACS